MHFNYGNSLSRILGKNYVKAKVLLNKLLKSWFDEIYFWWERISCFSTLCSVHQEQHFFVNSTAIWLQTCFYVKSISTKDFIWTLDICNLNSQKYSHTPLLWQKFCETRETNEFINEIQTRKFLKSISRIFRFLHCHSFLRETNSAYSFMKNDFTEL